MFIEINTIQLFLHVTCIIRLDDELVMNLQFVLSAYLPALFNQYATDKESRKTVLLCVLEILCKPEVCLPNNYENHV